MAVSLPFHHHHAIITLILAVALFSLSEGEIYAFSEYRSFSLTAYEYYQKIPTVTAFGYLTKRCDKEKTPRQIEISDPPSVRRPGWSSTDFNPTSYELINVLVTKPEDILSYIPKCSEVAYEYFCMYDADTDCLAVNILSKVRFTEYSVVRATIHYHEYIADVWNEKGNLEKNNIGDFMFRYYLQRQSFGTYEIVLVETSYENTTAAADARLNMPVHGQSLSAYMSWSFESRSSLPETVTVASLSTVDRKLTVKRYMRPDDPRSSWWRAPCKDVVQREHQSEINIMRVKYEDSFWKKWQHLKLTFRLVLGSYYGPSTTSEEEDHRVREERWIAYRLLEANLMASKSAGEHSWYHNKCDKANDNYIVETYCNFLDTLNKRLGHILRDVQQNRDSEEKLKIFSSEVPRMCSVAHIIEIGLNEVASVARGG